MNRQSSDSAERCVDLHEMLERVCDSNMDDASREVLFGKLSTSQEARQVYVRYLSLDFWLRLRFSRYKDNLESSELADVVAKDLDYISDSRTGRQWVVGVAVAATLMFIFIPVVAWLSVGSGHKTKVSSMPRAYAAIVTSTHDCRWESNSRVDRLGQVIYEGDQLRLKSGLVEVRFDSGAVAVLKGPVDLVVTGANTCSLLEGEFVARIDRGSNGFTVDAGVVRFVDVGTEFGVKRNSKKDYLLHIFQGEVQVFDNYVRQAASSQRFLGSVLSKEAAKVAPDESGNMSLHKMGKVSSSQFVREMPESSREYASSGSTLVALDGFGCGTGGRSLAGVNSGFGWRSPWQHKTTELTTSEMVVFSEAVTLANRGAAALHRHLPREMGISEAVYSSARFCIDGPDQKCTAWILLFEGEEKSGGGESNTMAFGISDRRISARLAPRDGDLAVNPNSKRLGDFGIYEEGTEHLLVTKLEFNAKGGKEMLSVWIDPSHPADGATPAPDHVVLYDTGKQYVDSVAIRFWEVDGETKGHIDDLRIGTTWEAVVD